MKPDLFCRNKTLYAGKTVQGNHTNSAEIETLSYQLKLYISLDDGELSFDCLKKLVTKHCTETHSIKGKKKKKLHAILKY